jgi:hypothetical protein
MQRTQVPSSADAARSSGSPAPLSAHQGLVWRRWNRSMLAIATAAALSVPALNLFIDPYDVFGTSPLGAGSLSNQPFQHLRVLGAKGHGFNTVVLGTSVAGIADPRDVDTALGGGARTYNAGVFLASPSDLRLMVGHLQRAGTLPERLVIGLDPFLLLPRPRHVPFQFTLPSAALGRGEIAWLPEALFAASVPHMASKVVEWATGLRSVVLDPERGGYRLPLVESGQHRPGPPPAGQGAHARTTVSRLAADQVLELHRLVEAAGATGAEVVWFIQPLSPALAGRAEVRQALDVLKQAVPVASDLSRLDLSSLVEEPWIDDKHYSKAAAAAVMRVVLGARRASPDLARAPSR